MGHVGERLSEEAPSRLEEIERRLEVIEELLRRVLERMGTSEEGRVV